MNVGSLAYIVGECKYGSETWVHCALKELIDGKPCVALNLNVCKSCMLYKMNSKKKDMGRYN